MHHSMNMFKNSSARTLVDAVLLILPTLLEMRTDCIVLRISLFLLTLPTEHGPFNGPTSEDGSTLEIIMHASITRFLEDLPSVLNNPQHTLALISRILTKTFVLFIARTLLEYAPLSLVRMEHFLSELPRREFLLDSLRVLVRSP